VIGFLITTNHKTDGIFLPADDRRHYVAWSNFTKEDFTPKYWNDLWGFYNAGGFWHVTTYLSEFDISDFDPKAPPPQTPAFWDIVGTNIAPEDAELADVLDNLGRPSAITISHLITMASGGITEWLLDRRNRRALPHRLERCGYVSVHKPGTKDGHWVFKGVRQRVYARSELSLEERLAAADKLK